jgi:hypothetical protein
MNAMRKKQQTATLETLSLGLNCRTTDESPGTQKSIIKSTLVQVVQKVVVHKQFFRQSHCFTYIVTSTTYKYGIGSGENWFLCPLLLELLI